MRNVLFKLYAPASKDIKINNIKYDSNRLFPQTDSRFLGCSTGEIIDNELIFDIKQPPSYLGDSLP